MKARKYSIWKSEYMSVSSARADIVVSKAITPYAAKTFVKGILNSFLIGFILATSFNPNYA